MQRSNYIIYDCETGGLDPQKNPITQFAGIVLDFKTLREVDRWETFVKPYNDLKIDPVALEKTMVTMSDINRGLEIKSFRESLCEFFESNRAKARSREQGRLIPVGHNIPFDNAFLDYALATGRKDLFDYVYPNFIDTYPLAKLVWGLKGDEKLTLTACCERASVKLTDAHGAMNDVEATADLLRFYVRRLRSKKTDEVTTGTTVRRGKEFFEFKCGAK